MITLKSRVTSSPSASNDKFNNVNDYLVSSSPFSNRLYFTGVGQRSAPLRGRLVSSSSVERLTTMSDKPSMLRGGSSWDLRTSSPIRSRNPSLDRIRRPGQSEYSSNFRPSWSDPSSSIETASHHSSPVMERRNLLMSSYKRSLPPSGLSVASNLTHRSNYANSRNNLSSVSSTTSSTANRSALWSSASSDVEYFRPRIRDRPTLSRIKSSIKLKLKSDESSLLGRYSSTPQDSASLAGLSRYRHVIKFREFHINEPLYQRKASISWALPTEVALSSNGSSKSSSKSSGESSLSRKSSPKISSRSSSKYQTNRLEQSDGSEVDQIDAKKREPDTLIHDRSLLKEISQINGKLSEANAPEIKISQDGDEDTRSSFKTEDPKPVTNGFSVAKDGDLGQDRSSELAKVGSDTIPQAGVIEISRAKSPLRIEFEVSISRLELLPVPEQVNQGNNKTSFEVNVVLPFKCKSPEKSPEPISVAELISTKTRTTNKQTRVNAVTLRANATTKTKASPKPIRSTTPSTTAIALKSAANISTSATAIATTLPELTSTSTSVSAKPKGDSVITTNVNTISTRVNTTTPSVSPSTAIKFISDAGANTNSAANVQVGSPSTFKLPHAATGATTLTNAAAKSTLPSTNLNNTALCAAYKRAPISAAATCAETIPRNDTSPTPSEYKSLLKGNKGRGKLIGERDRSSKPGAKQLADQRVKQGVVELNGFKEQAKLVGEEIAAETKSPAAATTINKQAIKSQSDSDRSLKNVKTSLLEDIASICGEKETCSPRNDLKLSIPSEKSSNKTVNLSSPQHLSSPESKLKSLGKQDTMDPKKKSSTCNASQSPKIGESVSRASTSLSSASLPLNSSSPTPASILAKPIIKKHQVEPASKIQSAKLNGAQQVNESLDSSAKSYPLIHLKAGSIVKSEDQQIEKTLPTILATSESSSLPMVKGVDTKADPIVEKAKKKKTKISGGKGSKAMNGKASRDTLKEQNSIESFKIGESPTKSEENGIISQTVIETGRKSLDNKTEEVIIPAERQTPCELDDTKELNKSQTIELNTRREPLAKLYPSKEKKLIESESNKIGLLKENSIFDDNTGKVSTERNNKMVNGDGEFKPDHVNGSEKSCNHHEILEKNQLDNKLEDISERKLIIMEKQDSQGKAVTDSNKKTERKRIRFRPYNMDDFVLRKVLGRGSFGKVYLAQLKDHEVYFAIKFLKKHVVIEDDDLESILIERKVLALGVKHPFICKLFCTFQTKVELFLNDFIMEQGRDNPVTLSESSLNFMPLRENRLLDGRLLTETRENLVCFVMEYLAGGDLMFHVQSVGKFSEDRTRFYAAETVSALNFLHSRYIVYRDLKLDNILLDSEGHIRLVDFGMSQCHIWKEECLPSNFCGTPEYMAPEIIKGVQYNHSVDWWSFGVLLYEMLVGESPFKGTDEDELLWNVCYEKVRYPRFLSKNSESIISLCLERNPVERLGMPTCSKGDIRFHKFFDKVNWDLLNAGKVKPPFVPNLKHSSDTCYFDREFTEMRPVLSPIDDYIADKLDHELFVGFDYTNPNMTD